VKVKGQLDVLEGIIYSIALRKYGLNYLHDSSTVSYDGKTAIDGKAVVGKLKYQLLLRNWPKLLHYIAELWVMDTRLRTVLHNPISDFVRKDYQLWGLASGWDRAGVYIQVIDDLNHVRQLTMDQLGLDGVDKGDNFRSARDELNGKGQAALGDYQVVQEQKELLIKVQY
jgi:hypothetical protein